MPNEPKQSFSTKIKEAIATSTKLLADNQWNNPSSTEWVYTARKIPELREASANNKDISVIFVTIRIPNKGLGLAALKKRMLPDGTSILTDPIRPGKQWRSIERYVEEAYPKCIGLVYVEVKFNRIKSNNIKFIYGTASNPKILHEHIARKKFDHYIRTCIYELLKNKEFMENNPSFRKFAEKVLTSNDILSLILAEHSEGKIESIRFLYEKFATNESYFYKQMSSADANGLAQITKPTHTDLQRDYPELFGQISYEKLVGSTELSLMGLIVRLYHSYHLIETEKKIHLSSINPSELKDFLFAAYNEGPYSVLKHFKPNKNWKINLDPETKKYLHKIRKIQLLLSGPNELPRSTKVNTLLAH